jgi:hypothetical protein
LQDLYPLNRGDATSNAVISCKLEISLDPSSGGVKVDMQKGDDVLNLRNSYYFYLQVLGFLALVTMAIVLFYVYTIWSERSEISSHEAWLRDFYEKNAPSKVN